ncbi:MAG: hypothetical protein FJY67_00385 [Calditrichaeota bacterium]|nr:hypothetical protein [Calditrichota bacterium]
MNSTEPVRPDSSAVLALRRAALEEQTARAIQRAQKQYLANNLNGNSPRLPAPGPAHLGSRIDVEA